MHEYTTDQKLAGAAAQASRSFTFTRQEAALFCVN